LKTARNTRIQDACHRKFPKLAAWKRIHGARTVLVLEENDIQLTNEFVVADAVLNTAKATENRPDEIYLVSTVIEPWWVSCILVDNRSFFDFTEPDERTWQIDPTTLAAITNR